MHKKPKKTPLEKEVLKRLKDPQKGKHPKVTDPEPSSEEHIPVDPSVPPTLEDPRNPQDPRPDDEEIPQNPNPIVEKYAS